MTDVTTRPRRRAVPVALRNATFASESAMAALLEPNDRGTWTFYRLYDEAGCLLYIGITKKRYPIERVLEHRWQKFWGRRIAILDACVSSFRDRRSAETHEASLIKMSRPRYNVHHGSHPDAVRNLNDWRLQQQYEDRWRH